MTSVDGSVEPDQVEVILERLRARGGRVTSQRRAIVSALFADEHHLTADRVAEVVQERLPDVHLSTVYRVLDTLEDEGVLEHVHLGHGRAIYHRSDLDHVHLVCDRCGAVGEMAPEILAHLSVDVERSTGFALGHQHFALAGRSASCRAEDPERPSAEDDPHPHR